MASSAIDEAMAYATAHLENRAGYVLRGRLVDFAWAQLAHEVGLANPKEYDTVALTLHRAECRRLVIECLGEGD